MNLSIEKLKSIVIVVLICIIIFGGSFLFSELNYYKNSSKDNESSASFSSFIDIDIDRYLSLLNFSKLSFIYIGKNDCQYSTAQDSVLKSIKEDYGFDIYYLNLSNVDSESIEFLYNSYDAFEKDGIGTPTIMLVQDGEVKAFKRGYTTYDNLLVFLEENNYIIK